MIRRNREVRRERNLDVALIVAWLVFILIGLANSF